jgi:hypothetical protein
MVYVEYGGAPVDTGHEFFWFPEHLQDPNIEIVHIARWQRWPKPNENLANFVAFISEEDADYLLLKYNCNPDDFHKF